MTSPKQLALAALYALGQARYCPVCRNYSRHFTPYGVEGPRPNAFCWKCGALERHRMMWVFFQERTNLFDRRPRRMLHVAPEACLVRQLKTIPSLDYLTADLKDPAAMEQMDITDIQHPAGAFDVILCSHVLEQIPDDRRAIAELYRVLAHGGWAVLMAPLRDGPTVEDPTVTDPAERARRFGVDKDVRRYGLDFKVRLEEAGFHVQCLPGNSVVKPEDVVRMGIQGNDYVFYCTKPSPP